MNWKPFARLCGVCGLSLAVVVGEEREHLDVNPYMFPVALRADMVGVQSTSADPTIGPLTTI